MTVKLGNGRVVEVLAEGHPSSPTIVFFGGTPCAAVPYEPLEAVVLRHGCHLLSYSRPGYGSSSPVPGRDVASAAKDTEQILDALDIGEFFALGWSGGGPHVLAVAALLGPRCLGAATIASVAPIDLLGDQWLNGMGEENIREVRLAQGDAPALEAHLIGTAELYRRASPQDVASLLGDTLSKADAAALDGPMASFILSAWRRAVLHGVSGWRDDSRAFVRPWGFDCATITGPLQLWHGTADRMVPVTHSEALAATTGGRLHTIQNEGHLRPMTAPWLDNIVDQLVR